MECFFVRKIIQKKAVRDLQTIVTVHSIIHSCTKPRDQLDDLADISQPDDVPHPRTISPQMVVEQEHVNIGRRCKNIHTIDNDLVQSRELEVFSV